MVTAQMCMYCMVIIYTVSRMHVQCALHTYLYYFPLSLSLSSPHPFPPPPYINLQVAGGSHAREVSYANFKAFNQFLGNLDLMERIVHSVTKSDPTAKITHGTLQMYIVITFSPVCSDNCRIRIQYIQM